MNHVIKKERRIRRIKQLTMMIPGTVLVLRERIDQVFMNKNDGMRALIDGKSFVRELSLNILFSKQYNDSDGYEIFFVLGENSEMVKRTLQGEKDWFDLGNLIAFDLYDNSKEVLKGFTPNFELCNDALSNGMNHSVEYTSKM